MAGAIRCPACGLVQLAKGGACKSCGKPLPRGEADPVPRAVATSRSAALDRPAEGRPVPAAARAGAPAGPLDPAFDRDRFLLRQRVWTIHERYDVADEEGQPVLFVERPGHHLKNLLAALAAITAGIVVGGLVIWIGSLVDSPVLLIVGIAAGIAAIAVVGTALAQKRHVLFYRDEGRQELLLEVLQDRKFVGLTLTYTIRDPREGVLAHLRKNLLTDVFRKKWECRSPDGRLLCVAKEASIIRAILRRVVTNLVVLNFVVCRGETDEVIGQFNRKFTILDRYVLDLSADQTRWLDRRIAVALGVMLDTGERR